MVRLIVLIKKNLLRFIKNPKTMGFLIIIPIVYYSLLGLIFGNIDFSDTTTTYNVGWVDNDLSEAKFYPNYNLEYLFNVTDDINGIHLINYSSVEEAHQASLDGSIISYIVFPNSFESYLENRSRINIAFWNNDTTSSTNFSLMDYFNSIVSSTSNIFHFTYIPDSFTANAVIFNFDDYEYDSLFILNEVFFRGLDNSRNVNASYLFRKGTTINKNHYVLGTIQSVSNTFFHAKGCSSNLTFPLQYIDKVPNSTPFTPVSYEIYFLQSVSTAVQATIENIFFQTINSIVNNNPAEIEIDYEKKSTVGQVLNNITFSAPGYLLYGPMTILSFALVILTGEKKEGIYKRLASTEVTNWEIIVSNIISNIMLIFMQFGIGALILGLFGWNPIINSLFDGIVGIILTMFLFSFLILALAFTLVPIFKDSDSAGGGVWIIIIPLAMVSGIFVPIELFGETMKAIAAWLPTRFAVIALQNLLLNGFPLSHPDTLLNLGLLALYSIIILIIGIKAFNKFKK